MDIGYDWTAFPWACLFAVLGYTCLCAVQPFRKFYRFFTTKIRYTKNNQKALDPFRREDASVGFDLFTSEDITLAPLQTKTIDTGIVIEMPHHMMARVLEKSSNAATSTFLVRGGVIDPNYRGNLGVILWNYDPENTVLLKAGKAIAQLVFSYAFIPNLISADSIDTETLRSTRGSLNLVKE